MDEPIAVSQHAFSQETIDSLQDLGDTLRRIHRRLILEGYTIKDGQIFKPVKQTNE
jgi:hypothetical protein